MAVVVSVITDMNIGGAGRALLATIEGAGKRFEHIVILPEGSALAGRLESVGSAFVKAHGLADQSFKPSAIFSLRRILRRLKPDIVHCHAALSARVAARFCGAKIVYTRHSVFDPKRSDTVFPKKQLLGFVNNSLADAVIAVSPAAAKNLTDTGVDPKKISVVYNGVYAVPPAGEDELKAARSRFGVSDGDFVVSAISRLEGYKGHSYMIKAAEALASYPDIKFLFAGTGADEQSLKDAAKHLPNVIFTGFVRDIEAISRISGITINASYGTEATSLALLECMSLGVPAVVSDFGGNPYVVTDGVNGLVTPMRDADALAAAIISLYKDRALLKKLSGGAKRVFEEKFTARRMIDGIEAVYDGLLLP